MSYAEGTTVSVDKSKSELDRLLEKHGARSRLFGEDEHAGAFCIFILGGRQVRLRVPLPTVADCMPKEWKQEPRGWYRLDSAQRERWASAKRDQIARERWRALILIVKAKLEVIALKLSTVEREFLADLYLPDGRTVHEALAPQIDEAYRTGAPPRLLGDGR